MKILRRSHQLALILLTAALVGSCSVGDIAPEERVARARIALEHGEIRTAIIELKNALQAQPNNGIARLMLGQAYAQGGDGASAEKELGRARELGISEADLQPWLAKAQLLQGELDPLYELDIPTDASPAVHAELLRLRAQAQLAKGDAALAEQSAKQALALEKDSPASMVVMARIMANRGDADGAREWISRAVDIDPRNALAWSLLGDIERSRRNLQAAQEAYTKAMQDPRLADAARLSRIIVSIETQKWDEAKADIGHLRERNRQDPRVDYVEALFNYRQQNYAEAASLSEAALSVAPNYTPALFLAGASRLALGSPSSASKHLTDYLARKPDDVGAQRMMAAVWLQLGEPAEAEKILDPIVDRFPEDIDALNLLANALISQGKNQESVSYLLRVAAAQPESLEAQARLGAVLLDQGDSLDGTRALEQGLQADPALKDAAEGISFKENLDEALQKALENLERNPDSASAHVTLGLLYLLRKDNDNASKAFLKVLEIDPGHPEASSALALLALEKGDVEKAKGYYQESLNHQPDNITALVNLARIAEAQGDRDAAKGYLEEAIAQAPADITPRLHLGQYYLAEQEPQKCLDLLEEVRAENSDNPKLLALLVRAQLDLARYSDAVTTLEALTELIPNELNIRMTLANVYTTLGQNHKAGVTLEEILKLDPKFVPAIKGLATLAIQQKDVREAQSRVQQLRNRLGTGHQDVLLLEGQLAELQGELPAAVAAYRKLFDSAQTSANLRRLANAQWRSGDKDAALRSMEEWVAEHPDDASVQLELGQRYLLVQRNLDAQVRFERTLDVNPENVVAMNNLAWLLRDKEPAKALEHAERAHAIAPGSPAILDTFAMALLANGDAGKAAETIERALKDHPENPELRFHQAQILEARGNSEEARLALQALLESGTEFPEREEAQAMLRRLEAE